MSLGSRYICENYGEQDLFCLITSVTAEIHSCRVQFPEHTSIQLQFAHLDELSVQLLYRMQNVERLDIFNSHITSAFLKPELNYFRVSRCQLNEVQIDTAEPYHLTELHLPENELATVPKDLNHLSNLTLLDLSNNHLSVLDMQDFTGLDHLTILGLSYNSIKVVFSTGFVRMASLKFLNLAHNQITTLDISRWVMPTLNELDVSSNSLDQIENILVQLPGLNTVRLDGNQWDCTWRDDVLEMARSTNRTFEWIGLDPCHAKVKIQGLAQKSRNEQKLKDSLGDSITKIAKNVTQNVINFDDIIDDVFCRIVGGQ